MSIYQPFEFDVEPEDLSDDQIAFLEAALPGWEPHEGNLELILIRANSQLASELRTMINDVPPAIFRYFGPLVGVPPRDAIAATASTTWTMIDSAGYTIPAGTLVQIPATGDEAMAFEVLADVTVAPGSTVTGAGEVVLVAVEPGAAANGLGGSAALLEPLDYVASIALVGTVAGGADAESDDEYQDRLAAELTLLTPTPILPADFALLAQTVTGVERAMAIDGPDVAASGVNEIQEVIVDATGGNFTLTFSGQTTGNIAFNASGATIQAALEALSNIAPGDVSVTDPTGGATSYHRYVEFKGAYLHTNVPLMTATNVSLTWPFHLPFVAVSLVQDGASFSAPQEKTVLVASVDATGEAVNNTVKAAVVDLLESLRETNFVVLVVDANYTAIDVTFTAVALPDYDTTDVRDRAVAALADYLSPANWGQPRTGDVRAWVNTPTVRFLEVSQVLNEVEGLDYLTALTVQGAGANVALTGQAPLTRPGTLTGTVSAP